MSDYQTMFGDLGGAAADLFQVMGAGAASKSYGQAVQADIRNEFYEKESTAIQEAQLARKIGMTIGTENADVAGAGFTSGGSAQDLLRSSLEQGALEKQMVNIEGTIKENQYAQEAAAAQSEADAAKTTGIAGIFGGVLKLAGAAATFF